jgi:hypothetical protein
MVWDNARTRGPYAKITRGRPEFFVWATNTFLNSTKRSRRFSRRITTASCICAAAITPPPPTTTTTPEGEAGSAQVCNYATQAAAPDEAAQLQLLLLPSSPTTSTLAHALEQTAASSHLKTKVRIPRSFAFKQNVIECYTQCLSNKSITNPASIVADMYNVHHTLVIRWYRDRLTIKPKAKGERTRDATRRDAGGQHKTLNKYCDKKLLEEFKEKRQKGNRIGPKWLKTRMRQLLL